jgi:hypothetical protein
MLPLPAAFTTMLPVILAEAMPDPASAPSVGWLLLTVAALAVAINQVSDLIAKFRKKEPAGTEILDQPLEVRPSPEYARREELNAVASRVSHLEAKFDEAVQTLSEQGEDRARRLHARMDTILEAVAEVRGELKRIPHKD